MFKGFVPKQTDKQTQKHESKHTNKTKEKRQKKERETCGLTKSEIERSIKQRRVTRPPYQELIDLVKTNGYSKTGKMFGVSDNSIRKWIKSYEKDL